MPPHNDSASTSSPRCGCASRSPPLTRRGTPRDFVFLCFLSWPSGVFFFFFWVGWGSSCRVCSSPSFLVLGCWVGDFCYLLHLASPLAPRETWSTDPQPPRPLQLFALACPASPVSCWELSVGRAEVKGCRVTRGVVTPYNS